jgi:Tol biopolymer transport system component
MRLDGTPPVVLTTGLWPSWSSDGRKIAFYGSLNAINALFMMNADGSGMQQIPTAAGFGALYPAYRP